MQKRYSRILFFVIFWQIIVLFHISANEYSLVPGVIHLDSDVSGGEYSIKKLVEIAKSYEQEIVIITDHDNHEVTYGIWPLQNILKKTVKRDSIRTYGAKKYIADMEEAQKAYPEIVVIHGAEAIPFYYWEGSYQDNDLKLINLHKHILVIGLDKAKEYKNLPSIARGYPREFSTDILFSLWPLIFIIFATWLLLKKCRKKTRYRRNVYITYSWINIVICIISFLIGIIFSINNFPFFPQKYDQYHGNEGIGPYQEVIDYVNDKGGLTFWAHPEVEYKPTKIDNIELYTPSYQEDLLKAENYTGFAVFYEGMKYIGLPNGIWDKILVDYCNGTRKNPVWAIGEVDFEGDNRLEEIKHTQTFFLLKEKSRDAVLEALRKGRLYAARAVNDEFFLTDFSVANSNGNIALMGEEIKCSTPPKIKISFLYKRTKKRNIECQLIRMGKVIKTFNIDDTTDIEYTDTDYGNQKKIYYRLIISEGNFAKIVSNPIFVQL